MKKIALMLAVLGLAVSLKAEPIAVELGGNKFILPLQLVSGTQLYSFDEGRGYPALETVLAQRGKAQLSVGAAPVLGTSANVPFVALQFRLSEKFFDISDNNVYFGAWVGKPSNQKDAAYGILCSVPLW